MPVTTRSSRAFNQNTSFAKKADADGPVVITDLGLADRKTAAYFIGCVMEAVNPRGAFTSAR